MKTIFLFIISLWIIFSPQSVYAADCTTAGNVRYDNSYAPCCAGTVPSQTAFPHECSTPPKVVNTTQNKEWLCSSIMDTTQRSHCNDCMSQPKHMWTAIGCVPTDPEVFVSEILPVAISIAGAIAFLLILFGGFQVLISAGNPEKVHEGKEIISGAIAGLLLIIFSVFLLRMIGYNILHIPGFG